MRVMDLLQDVTFRETAPTAEPIYFDPHGRILRFSLQPGQQIAKHKVPTSPLYIVILQGEGVFRGGDGTERRVGPNTLLVFDPAEEHAVWAEDQELVFVAFLRSVPGARPEKAGGTLVRDEIL